MRKTFLLLLIILITAGIIGLSYDSFSKYLQDNYLKQEVEPTETDIPYVFLTSGAEPTLDLFTLEPNIRTRLINVYEGLVSTDENFTVTPALAVSWGRLNDTDWEFTLRQNVFFQDNTALTANLVIDSLEAAFNGETKGLLSTVQDVQKISDDKIIIRTKDADPLLLQKLAQIFIYKPNDNSAFLPYGTGPYQISEQTNEHLKLTSFADYWGGKPYVQSAIFLSTTNSTLKKEVVTKSNCAEISKIDNALCGVISDVPESKIGKTSTELKEYRFSKLETIFLVFNYNSKNLPDADLQNKLITTLNQTTLAEEMGILTSPATQYFASGSFGHNPEISLTETEEVEKGYFLLQDRQPTLTLNYLNSDQLLAQYLKHLWEPLGLTLNIVEVNPETMQTNAQKGLSDLYLTSWQVGSGDAGEFFSEMAHTKTSNYGQFNWSNYNYSKLDSQIEKAAHEMNWEKRLTLLREISKATLQNNPLGIPLLEARTVYAAHTSLIFTPRADGLIQLSTLKPNLN